MFTLKLCTLCTVTFCVRRFFQDQSFLIFPPLFRLTIHSPSLQKASRSNLHPIFSNCMQSDITQVPFCLTIFSKKQLYTTAEFADQPIGTCICRQFSNSCLHWPILLLFYTFFIQWSIITKGPKKPRCLQLYGLVHLSIV